MSMTEEELRRQLGTGQRVPAGQPSVTPASRLLAAPPGSTPTTVVPQPRATIRVDAAGRGSTLALPPPGPRQAPTTTVPPRNPTIVVDSIGRAGVGAPPASPAPATPAYRTGAAPGQPQFQQTPTPTNPNPRGVTAPAAPAPASPAATAPRVRQPIGRAGQAAIALEALNVAGAAQQGGGRAAIGEAAEGVGRLASARLGAQLGRTLGPWGAGVGGVVGYLGGDRAITAIENNTPAPVRNAFTGTMDTLQNAGNQLWSPENSNSVARTLGEVAPDRQGLGDMLFGARAPAAIAPAPAPAAAALAAPPAAAATPLTRAAQRVNIIDGTAATAGIAPPTATGGGEVVGEWNGRPITRAQANQLAGQLNGGTGTGLVNGNPTGAPAAVSPPAATMLAAPPARSAQGAVIGGSADNFDAFARQIDRQISELGQLNMRSKRQLVGELLGLKGRALGQQADIASGNARASAELGQRTASDNLRAQVDREQIAATDRNARRQTTQTITDDQGNVFGVDGTTLTPIRTPEGRQLRTTTRQAAQQDNTQARIAADLLGSLLPMNATQDDVNAAVQQANTAAAALMGQGGAQSTPAAPPGYTLIGTSNGKPVYRDAQGNQVIEE